MSIVFSSWSYKNDSIDIEISSDNKNKDALSTKDDLENYADQWLDKLLEKNYIVVSLFWSSFT